MRSSRGTVLVALTTLLAACGSETPTADAPAELRAIRATVYGADDGEGALSAVFGVAVSGDGHVFVSEPRFARVVEFEAGGAFLRIVGGRGDGPGEFNVPGSLAWRGDSLAVTDFQRGIHLFTPEGSFAERVSFILRAEGSPFGVRPILPLDDGSVAAMAPAPATLVLNGSVTREVWLRASRDGVVLDTLVALPLAGRHFSVRVGDFGRSGGHPLAWAPLLTAPPSGTSLLVVDGPPSDDLEATFQVVRIGLTGDTLATAVVPYTPIPVTGADMDSIASGMAERWAGDTGPTAAALAAAVEEQVEWPDAWPPVTEALVGDDGSVWLRRERPDSAGMPWDVLDETLRPVGRVHLPPGLQLEVVARHRVYGVERDEFDVPRVVRFDLVGGSR